jgi:hypothetical protein
MDLAGDRDRENAAASLREHFANGRLTLEEFSQRTELALRARSRDELRRALAGLPQINVRRIVESVSRGVMLVLFTGAWLVFSFVLLVVFALTVVIHGATGFGMAIFLLVWLIPTYLLSRLWRRGGHRRRGWGSA